MNQNYSLIFTSSGAERIKLQEPCVEKSQNTKLGYKQLFFASYLQGCLGQKLNQLMPIAFANHPNLLLKPSQNIV